jgi:hypothetical protein
MTDEEQARREAAMERMLANPMPRELSQQVAAEIEPHTLNADLKHGEVMLAVKIAYPLIRDFLREHPESLNGNPA